MMFASYFSPEFTESFDNAVENLNKIIKFDVFKILNVARFLRVFFVFEKSLETTKKMFRHHSDSFSCLPILIKSYPY